MRKRFQWPAPINQTDTRDDNSLVCFRAMDNYFATADPYYWYAPLLNLSNRAIEYRIDSRRVASDLFECRDREPSPDPCELAKSEGCQSMIPVASV